MIVQALRNATLLASRRALQIRGRPIERCRPMQKPNPPFWYARFQPEGVVFAAKPSG